MGVFAEFLARIDNQEHRDRLEAVLTWVARTFPNLTPRVAWNQPMFTDHGTFIVGFSVAKNHLAVAPERAGIERFSDEIVRAGYTHHKQLLRIPGDGPVDYALLQRIVEYNIQDKADSSTFWRK